MAKIRKSARDNQHRSSEMKDLPSGGIQQSMLALDVTIVDVLCWSLLLCCSVVVSFTLGGLTSGMIISIHYYENESPAARRMDLKDTSTLYNGPAAYQRVTNLDPSIASSNVLQKGRDGLDLGNIFSAFQEGSTCFDIFAKIISNPDLADICSSFPTI